jgi:hypothetical protein
VAQGPAFYCQGWLRQLLSPLPLVWHNGGTPGSKAVAAFTPGGDLGVVILSNLDGTELPEALMYYLYDLYYGRPEKDHSEEFLKDAKARTDAVSTNDGLFIEFLPAMPYSAGRQETTDFIGSGSRTGKSLSGERRRHHARRWAATQASVVKREFAVREDHPRASATAISAISGGRR